MFYNATFKGHIYTGLPTIVCFIPPVYYLFVVAILNRNSWNIRFYPYSLNFT